MACFGRSDTSDTHIQAPGLLADQAGVGQPAQVLARRVVVETKSGSHLPGGLRLRTAIDEGDDLGAAVAELGNARPLHSDLAGLLQVGAVQHPGAAGEAQGVRTLMNITPTDMQHRFALTTPAD